MSRVLELSHLLTVAVLLYPNGFLAIQHTLVLTNTTSVIHPKLGNVSTLTMIDTKISFSCYIFHNIENAIISTELNVKYTDYGPYTNFFKKRLNFCEFITNPSTDPLLYLGYKLSTFDKNNRIFTKCPIKAGYYFIKDVSVNITDVPIPVHNLKFNSIFEFLEPETNQSLISYIEGRIQTSSKRNAHGKSSRKRG